MNRMELNKKYYIYGEQADKNCSNEELIQYYKKYQDVLLDLLDDLKTIESETRLLTNELNIRQRGCINRCSSEFVDSGWHRIDQKYTQAFYEIIDFIYYPGYEYKELAKNEIETIRIMASYLIMKADEIIYTLKHEFKQT